LPERLALIASGINHGSNLGDDVTTPNRLGGQGRDVATGAVDRHLAARRRGSGSGGRAARLVAMRALVEGLPPKTLLNVNVPAIAPRGLRFTRLGHRVYAKIVEQVDPRGRTHYWLGAGPPEWEALGTDMGAVHGGSSRSRPCISISPTIGGWR
jgi:5'-nucleotidase